VEGGAPLNTVSGTERGGYTLLELAITASLMTLLMGSLLLFGGSSTGAMSAETSQVELDAQLRRTVARMSKELMPSGMEAIVLDEVAPGAGTGLTYRKSHGPVSGVNSWGTPSRLAFAYELGEVDDGLDNNGNGLVDEGVLEWTMDAGLGEERRVILCHGVRELGEGEVENGLDDDGDGLVDEPGLLLQRIDGVMHLSLTLERLDSSRRPIVRSLTTRIRPRN
jgi:hypothetical protein